MKREFDLSKLDWILTGYTPYVYKWEKEWFGAEKSFDTFPVKAKVPGSVQKSLLDAGIIEDWNIGDNSKKCEWVENRHWIYRTEIPDEMTATANHLRLMCLGLDYSGWIYVNNREIAEFKGTHIPHIFDLSGQLQETGNILEIIFDLPPRWLGQFGYTSRMIEFKTRFNYTWDWQPRMVQTGIWDKILLIQSDGEEFTEFTCTTDVDISTNLGIIKINGKISGCRAKTVLCMLTDDREILAEKVFTTEEIINGIIWDEIPVKLWWPNLEGEQPIYQLFCSLLDKNNSILDEERRIIGFKNVKWIPCSNAPEDADPWVCVVNGRPIFLQGFNFSPIRPNYADLAREDYEKLLILYKNIGCNMFRINACGFLEHECFYELCDRLGFLVWQDFPLTSSGIDNWAPEDEASISSMAEIARSFISRRQHHVSLTIWSGGNELQGDLDGLKTGIGKPCTPDHPMLKRLGEIVNEYDPIRRYIHTSPSGPRSSAERRDFGKGLHWDVHGPYSTQGGDEKDRDYWENDDALFRSELSCAGAACASTIRKYIGCFNEMPPDKSNPYWCRLASWWIDWDTITALKGSNPESLEEYVELSQTHQAKILSYAVRMCKLRFPKCGGVLLWGSHDTYPMPINASIIDFEGNPKKAAYALAEAWGGKI